MALCEFAPPDQHLFPVLRGSQPDLVFQKLSNKQHDEVIKHFPRSSGYNPIFTAKYTVSPHHSQVELISSLLSSRILRGFPAELAPRQSVSAQPSLVQGVSLSQVHSFAFIWVQYCEIPIGTFVYLGRSIWTASLPSWVAMTSPEAVICKLDEGAFFSSPLLLLFSFSIGKILNTINLRTDPFRGYTCD